MKGDLLKPWKKRNPNTDIEGEFKSVFYIKRGCFVLNFDI